MVDTTDGETSEETVRLSVEGRGITFSREISEEVAGAVIGIVLGHSPTTLQPPRVDAGVTDQMGRSETVGEFMLEVGAETFPEKMAAAAVFLRDREDRREFARDDLRQQLELAGESLPRNFARDFAKLVRRRWVSRTASDDERFFVTNTGAAAVRSGFDTRAESAVRATRSRTRGPS